jgi:hypothetical protein
VFALITGPSPAVTWGYAGSLAGEPCRGRTGDGGDGGMADDPETHIVADVDHVTTVLDGRTARRVFSALSRMGLFVAWPYLDYGPFASGGVRLGNLNLEVIGTDGEEAGALPAAVPAQEDAPGQGGWPRQFVALAPVTLEGLPAGLDGRGIRHGEPEPFTPVEGSGPLYTRVGLPDLGGGELAVQFCAYPEGPRTGTVSPRDLAGVQQVERVVVGASDADRAREQWAALLSPDWRESGGSWLPGYGPAVEVRPAAQDAVTELVVRVGALATARAAFTAAGLRVTGDVVEIGTLPARLVTG